MGSLDVMLGDTAFLRRIREGNVVIFAGAGVSMDRPSNVPGWFALNGMILNTLKRRVTGYLGRDPIWLDQVIQGLIGRRDSGGFPPEYQAQIMEEQCGESYFHALTAVDVAQRNRAHAAIAALARLGIVRAVVTTNFDCLIEQALDAEGVEYKSIIDEEGFRELRSNGAAVIGEGRLIPVLKIHGSVESATSMIDTLQQRMCGRRELLDELLVDLLGKHVVLYAGFSAADLNHDPSYLGLARSAETSPGAIFVRYPGSPQEPGEKMLLEAYGEKAHGIEKTLTAFFSQLFVALDIDLPEVPSTVDPDPGRTVASRLETWADALDPYEAINVLTALLDAGGEEDASFRVLHKTWKSRLSVDSEGEHYARYQYNYAKQCLQSGEMLYEETPQNFLRSHEVVPQSSAGLALWSMYRLRVEDFWPFLSEARAHTLFPGDPRLEGDLMHVFAQAAVIYRWTEHFTDIIEAGNRQYKAGDIPRAVRLWATAARLAARSDNPLQAFDLFDHCEWWVNYLGDDTLMAELYLAQGVANLERGSVGDARWCFGRAIPPLRRYQRWPLLIEGLTEGIRCSNAEGSFEQGIRLVHEANERILKGYEIYIPHLAIAVAEYHIKVERWERAKRELLKCRPLAEQCMNNWAVSTIDTYLKRIQDEMDPSANEE